MSARWLFVAALWVVAAVLAFGGSAEAGQLKSRSSVPRQEGCSSADSSAAIAKAVQQATDAARLEEQRAGIRLTLRTALLVGGYPEGFGSRAYAPNDATRTVAGIPLDKSDRVFVVGTADADQYGETTSSAEGDDALHGGLLFQRQDGVISLGGRDRFLPAGTVRVACRDPRWQGTVIVVFDGEEVPKPPAPKDYGHDVERLNRSVRWLDERVTALEEPRPELAGGAFARWQHLEADGSPHTAAPVSGFWLRLWRARISWGEGHTFSGELTEHRIERWEGSFELSRGFELVGGHNTARRVRVVDGTFTHRQEGFDLGLRLRLEGASKIEEYPNLYFVYGLSGRGSLGSYEVYVPEEEDPSSEFGWSVDGEVFIGLSLRLGGEEGGAR